MEGFATAHTLVAARRPNHRMYSQRTALERPAQPAVRPVGISRRRLARPNPPSFLHGREHPPAFWSGRFGSLRRTGARPAWGRISTSPATPGPLGPGPET